jgi:hypothetical protein
MDILDLFFKKYSYKFDKGYPDMNNNQDVLLLESILKELGVKIKLFEEVNFGVLKNIAGSEINDDTLKKIQSGDTFNLNLDNIYLSSGGSGKKYGGKDRYNINDLRTLIKEFDKPIILTYAGNVRKFRTPFGVRICTFNAPSNEKSPDFARLIVVNKLLEEFPDKIKVVPKIAPGLGYEAQQVENLNKNLEEILKQLGNDNVKLYVKGKDTGVEVASSEKVAGSGKADLVLKNNGGTEVYWISYKEGKYYTGEGDGKESKELTKDIPFQQYGSLVTLYSKSYDEEMQSFSKYLSKEIPDFLDAVFANLDSKYVFENADPSKLQSLQDLPDDIKSFSDQIRWKQLQKFAGNDKVDVCFIPPTVQFKRNFIKTGDKQAEILAGKAVWGLDFTGKGKDFGRENCNILLQNDGTVNITPIYEGEDIKGVNITPTETGHILFNPQLPINSEDPDFIYTPALNIRHTKAESFAYESKGKKKMILGGRLLIIPLGKVTSVPEV